MLRGVIGRGPDGFFSVTYFKANKMRRYHYKNNNNNKNKPKKQPKKMSDSATSSWLRVYLGSGGRVKTSASFC